MGSYWWRSIGGNSYNRGKYRSICLKLMSFSAIMIYGFSYPNCLVHLCATELGYICVCITDALASDSIFTFKMQSSSTEAKMLMNPYDRCDSSKEVLSWHDDITKWEHFPCYWSFVRGIHWSPVNSPHKGQWHGALMFSFICAWINGWVNNRGAGDLRHSSCSLWRKTNLQTPVDRLTVADKMGGTGVF